MKNGEQKRKLEELRRANNNLTKQRDDLAEEREKVLRAGGDIGKRMLWTEDRLKDEKKVPAAAAPPTRHPPRRHRRARAAAVGSDVACVRVWRLGQRVVEDGPAAGEGAAADGVPEGDERDEPDRAADGRGGEPGREANWLPGLSGESQGLSLSFHRASLPFSAVLLQEAATKLELKLKQVNSQLRKAELVAADHDELITKHHQVLE